MIGPWTRASITANKEKSPSWTQPLSKPPTPDPRRTLTLREEAEMLTRYSSLQRRRFCRCFIDMTRTGQALARVVAELGGAGCRPTTR